MKVVIYDYAQIYDYDNIIIFIYVEKFKSMYVIIDRLYWSWIKWSLNMPINNSKYWDGEIKAEKLNLYMNCFLMCIYFSKWIL